MEVRIKLTKGKEAIIDEADLPLVSQYNWHATNHGKITYAASSKLRRSGGGVVYLHRLLMNPPPGLFVDHINGDGLDCRRQNMRLCTDAQNKMNSHRNPLGRSKYKGVHHIKSNPGRPWGAKISVENRGVTLGSYATEEEAARAYNAAALKYYGEFACLNTIEGMTYEESITPPAHVHKRGRPAGWGKCKSAGSSPTVAESPCYGLAT